MAEIGFESVSTPEGTGATIYLMQVSGNAERRILEQWLLANGSAGAESPRLQFPPLRGRQRKW